MIFSNEHCHSRLTEHRHIQKLSDLLSKYFESITILVYIRRQDEMARSAYSQCYASAMPLSIFCLELYHWLNTLLVLPKCMGRVISTLNTYSIDTQPFLGKLKSKPGFMKIAFWKMEI